MNHEDDFFKTRKSIQEKRIHTFSTTVKYYLAVIHINSGETISKAVPLPLLVLVKIFLPYS